MKHALDKRFGWPVFNLTGAPAGWRLHASHATGRYLVATAHQVPGQGGFVADPACPIGVPVTYTLSTPASSGSSVTLTRHAATSTVLSSRTGAGSVEVARLDDDSHDWEVDDDFTLTAARTWHTPGHRPTEGVRHLEITTQDSAALAVVLRSGPFYVLHNPLACGVVGCDVAPVLLAHPRSIRTQVTGHRPRRHRRAEISFTHQVSAGATGVDPLQWGQLGAAGWRAGSSTTLAQVYHGLTGVPL